MARLAPAAQPPFAHRRPPAAIRGREADGAARLLASLDAQRKALVLTVRDNGRGMSDAELRHCCDIFYTTKEHGSGVGLPICRQVVEQKKLVAKALML